MKNILIYTGPSCNFCDAAKRLLERNKLKFSEIDVSSGAGIRAVSYTHLRAHET